MRSVDQRPPPGPGDVVRSRHDRLHPTSALTRPALLAPCSASVPPARRGCAARPGRSRRARTLERMCGIVGYVGDKQALEVVVEGLRRLEYRGYDSAGVAVVADG